MLLNSIEIKQNKVISIGRKPEEEYLFIKLNISSYTVRQFTNFMQ